MELKFTDFMLDFNLRDKKTFPCKGYGEYEEYLRFKQSESIFISADTKKEIYEITSKYFNVFKKNIGFLNDGLNLVKSKYVFKLFNTKTGKDEKIYNITIDTDENILEENFFFNEEEKKPYDFRIVFEVFLTYKVVYEDEDEDEEEEQPFITAIKEELCCICCVNKPNIFYSDCRHFLTCYDCEQLTTLNKCPLCRTEVTIPKIKI